MARAIVEPFKIKVVEPIPFFRREEREAALAEAGFNLFALPAEKVTFDFLTDSGTSAMSSAQWSAMMRADESYAGSRSFYRFEKVVRDLTGYRHVIPTHQGRAAERILFALTVKKDSIIPSNSHFDTTRANIEADGGVALDLVIAEGRDPRCELPFKGNIDLDKLDRCCRENQKRIPFGMLTITNNTGGGQPVSLANIKAAAEILHKHGLPLILDACRFAENAFLIEQREPDQKGRAIREVAREVFRLADGCTMSAKKDGLVNMGGFLALNNDQLAEEARKLLILTEGFPTYGGCAARDLEAMAVGIEEAMDPHYLEYRHASVRYLANGLEEAGIPTVRPPGGHAVYIDARAFLDHIRPEQFPGQALVCALYLEGGIRSCEVGTVMFGREENGKLQPAPLDLVRLALPRRVYTQSHVDFVLDVARDLVPRKREIQGLRIREAPKALRHFTAKFEPV